MLNRHRVRLSGLSILLFTAGYLVFGFGNSSAFILFNRSVEISSGVPSAAATHSFKFDVPTTSDIGSIVFEYCSNNPYFADPCTAPAGIDASGAALAGQSGNTGFSIDNADTTSSRLVLTRPTSPGLITSNSYVFSNIINPSTAGLATYVRISTHAATDGSGPAEDTGAVAFAVQTIFEVDAFVPPFLQICVGITVAPDCSSTSGDSIDLGVLSSKHANDSQSQFAVATNDINGYTVFSLGTTMTSGNNTIQSLPNPTPSFPGTPQFGINLRANLLPPVGQDPIGLGTGVPSANYNLSNRFLFNDGDSIASSPLTTNYNRMTVSYLVNVPSNQTPGIYATTVTYAATVQF
jgi:hypothetical protein